MTVYATPTNTEHTETMDTMDRWLHPCRLVLLPDSNAPGYNLLQVKKVGGVEHPAMRV